MFILEDFGIEGFVKLLPATTTSISSLIELSCPEAPTLTVSFKAFVSRSFRLFRVWAI
jgi:hypothetical protein